MFGAIVAVFTTAKDLLFLNIEIFTCQLIFLSYGPGLTSMQHTTSHATAVQSPSHYQLLVSNGINCLNLFHPI